MKTTVIIPVHKVHKDIEELFEKSLKSVSLQKGYIPDTLIVAPEKIKKELEAFLKKVKANKENKLGNISVEYHTKSSDFQTQVNVGANAVETEFFSVLEYDDELSDIYINLLQEYYDAYSDFDLFLPLGVETSMEGKLLRINNEVFWSKNVIKEDDQLGLLNYDLFLNYTFNDKTNPLNITNLPNFTGVSIKKESFLDSGGLKKNIDVFFNYEFLMRFGYNGYKMIVIPKIGYLHRINRKDSLFENYKSMYSAEQVKAWFDNARKEYLFAEDRELKVL